MLAARLFLLPLEASAGDPPAPSATPQPGSPTTSPSTPAPGTGTTGTSKSGMGTTSGTSMGGGAGSSEQVNAVQKALQDKGMDPGPIDGVMGLKTMAALKAFQKDQ
jgi:peptidoglycan hydrolase-like protein with peptidoglycan-binding domain